MDSYWIDGYFHSDWNKKAYFSHDRGVYVPISATLRIKKNRIYLKESFAKRILNKKEFDSTNKYDMFDMSLKNKINVPWVKEVYSGPEVSLP